MEIPKYVPDPAIWLIYSREHNAFWRPARCGYTPLVHEAGRYTYADASAICYEANKYVKDERDPKEVAVVAPEAAVLAVRYRQFQHIVYEERDDSFDAYDPDGMDEELDRRREDLDAKVLA